jgi:hypothetical protein
MMGQGGGWRVMFDLGAVVLMVMTLWRMLDVRAKADRDRERGAMR